MSNLSKKTKSLLEKNSFLSRLKIEKILLSSDGAKKYIFQVDQENTIESVLIPDKSRLTLCISTQAGCSRGCKFCLTGKKGLSRNLTSSEIINQVLEVKRDIGKEIRISNLVIMGMGEPLDNFENVKKTVTIMLDREGFDFSSRRITLSTSGVIPGIKDLIESGLNINLAVSLNASSDKKRDVLMPVNRAFPLKELIVMIKKYPLKKRSRITFEYILLGGINDSLEDAENLVRLLKGIKAKINLLNFNPFPGSKFSLSSPGRVLEFQNFLMSKNLAVNLRKSRGIDILAACGQLGGKG